MSLSITPTAIKDHILSFLEPTRMHLANIKDSASEIQALSLTNSEFASICQPMLNTIKKIKDILEIPLKETPSITENNLSDVFSWLKLGDYVVIYAKKYGRFFHKCLGTVLINKEINEFAKSRRIIYLDVSSMPGLLDDGEWNYYIEASGSGRECTCNLKSRMGNPKHLPYVHMFAL